MLAMVIINFCIGIWVGWVCIKAIKNSDIGPSFLLGFLSLLNIGWAGFILLTKVV